MAHASNHTFGHEGQTKEFKTSFLFPARGCNEDQRFVVFKAVCAMMNTEGGQVFIGVNDKTRMVAKGPHYGVSGDREKLRIENNDVYVRYIRNRLDDFFFDAKYVRGIVHVEETESEDVILISVKKADRVVYMHRKGSNVRLAFRREGPASNEMDNAMIKQRELALRQEKAQKKASLKIENHYALLQEAIDQKRVVVLHDYSSSNSDSKEDRVVEPIAFICDGRSLWAYEERKEGSDPLRQFRLNRIEYVEILEEECKHESSYKEAFVDAFEWSRTTKPAVQITILLGPAATNNLVESTPEAYNYLYYNGDGQWTLDAMVHSLEPVKAFCQEFKDSITVYAPDELKRQLGLLPEEVADEATVEAKKTDIEVKEPDTQPNSEEALNGFWRILAKMRDALSRAISKRLEREHEGNPWDDVEGAPSMVSVIDQDIIIKHF